MSSPREPRNQTNKFEKELEDLRTQVAALEDGEALHTYVELAHALKEAGLLEEALAVANGGLEAFKGAPEDSRAEAFNILGQVLQQLNRPHDAIRAHEQMATLARAIDSAYLQSAALFALGAIQQTLGDTDGARALYARAFHFLRGPQDRDPQEVRLQVQILINLAGLRVESGETLAARELYASASELIDALDDQHLKTGLLLSVGRSHAIDRDYASAAVAYKQALRKARQSGELPLELIATQNLGAVHLDLGRPREARRWYQKGIDRSAHYAGIQQRVALLRGAASACLRVVELGNALKYLREAAELAWPQADKAQWAAITVELARLALRAGKPVEARTYLQPVQEVASSSPIDQVRDGYWQATLAIAATTNKPREEIEAALGQASAAKAASPSLLQAAAEHLAHLGEHERAAELAAQALLMRGFHGHERAWGQAQIGAQLLSVGGAKQAVRFFSAAARFYARAGDKQLLFQCKNDLANAHADLGRYHLAVKGYRACAALGRQLGDRAMEAQALSNWAETMRRQNKPKEALRRLRRAQELYQQLGDSDASAGTQATLGLILTDLDRGPEAAEAFRKSLKLALPDASDTRAVALGGLATLDTSAGRFKRAVNYYNRAIAIEQAAHDLSHEMESRAGILIAFSGIGDGRNASRTMKRLSFLLGRVGRSDLVSWATREAADAALDRGHRKLGLELLAVWVVLPFTHAGRVNVVARMVGDRIARVAIELVLRYYPNFRRPLHAVGRHAVRQVGELGAILQSTFEEAEAAAVRRLEKYGPPAPPGRRITRASH